MYREVATLRMLMSWTSPDSGTLYGTRIAHRMAESGYTSARVYKSINQSGFPQDFVISPRGKRHLGEI